MARTNDLFTVVQVFGADKANQGIDQQWLEFAGDGIGTGSTGLLVNLMLAICSYGPAKV